jgi:Arc/MetJ-type ribon-helix-helix transcriptional regulator
MTMSSIHGVKLSISMSEDDVRYLDEQAERRGYGSRSAVLQQAVRLLREHDLGDAYEEAWRDWMDSGEEAAWSATAADGLEPPA